jgi:hypothetical protein
VIGAAILFNNQKTFGRATFGSTPTSSQTFLFSSQDGNATDIKISDTNGDTVEISRNPTGTWVLKAPTADAADQSQAEAAASQVSSLNMLGNEQIGLPDVGLDKPTYTMTITFDSAKTHKVLIGEVNVIQTGYYVQVDGGPVQLVDKSGIDALVGMLTAPPYLATLTPTITLTPTYTAVPSDTPTAAPTFTPAATDTPTSLTPVSGTAVPSATTAPATTPTPP